MTETLNIPPVQSTQTELNDDMIPAIRASVVQKRIWQSIWSLLAWAALIIFLRFDFYIIANGENVWNIENDLSIFDWIIVNGGLIIALAMILLSFYGMITRHPRIILIDGSMVGLIGLWNIGTGKLLATLTQAGVHLDLDKRRPAVLPDIIRDKAKMLMEG